MCPTNNPGDQMSLLKGPRGSHVGGTSSIKERGINPRPPNLSQPGGTDSVVTSRLVTLILHTLSSILTSTNTLSLQIVSA